MIQLLITILGTDDDDDLERKKPNCDVLNADAFDEWDIKYPPRRSKKAKPKMGMSGRSLKNLIGPLIDRRKK